MVTMLALKIRALFRITGKDSPTKKEKGIYGHCLVQVSDLQALGYKLHPIKEHSIYEWLGVDKQTSY